MAGDAPRMRRMPGPLEDDRKGRGRAPRYDNLGFGSADRRSHRTGSGERAWKGGLADRVRVARGMPQAVLKIASYGGGAGDALRLSRYIGEQGETEVETDDGLILDTVEEMDQLAKDWSVDFSDRQGSERKARDVMHLVVSAPAGSDKEKTLNAAREFFAETFAENHEYAFAAHDETDHFHVHLLVKMRGRDGQQMRQTRRDPELWRQAFAECAREQGLELDASPRRARGVGRVSSPPMAVHELRERGDHVRIDRAAAREAMRRVHDPDDRPTASERAIRKLNASERLEYARWANTLAEEAKSMTNDQKRLKALEAASDLAVYAERMPVSRSRVEILMTAIKPEREKAKRVSRSQELARLSKLTERSLRDQVASFQKGGLQRRAIAARAQLSKVLQPYERARQQNRDRDFGR